MTIPFRSLGIFLAMAALLLGGCATGSAIVTGAARTPIDDWRSVRLLDAFPEGAEVIALVQARSDSGMKYAVERLQQEAAKVGANAVVVEGRGSSEGVMGMPVYGGGTIMVPVEYDKVEGRAVFVQDLPGN